MSWKPANQELILKELTEFRKAKDDFFAHHLQSPLTGQQKETFKGLRYFDYNPELDLTVHVTEDPDKEVLVMQTSTGDTQQYRRFGTFKFTVEGQEAALSIYVSPHGFFLPFVDSLANKETYGAGRYLEPEVLADGLFRVDFNLAYNPYCAYNDLFSCPLTPFENRVKVPIRAGEKLPDGDWVEH